MMRLRASLRSAAMALLALLTALAIVLGADSGEAQQRRAPGRSRTPRAAPVRPFAPPPDGGINDLPGPGALATPPPVPNADAGVVEVRRLDGGTQIFKFKELDIEGRLKSPQLVYFLRRVRAEFAAGELGHRTFMREMSETRKESTF
jgi:hypothetical protein